MGELLDRAFQRKLLTDIADLYPRAADIERSYDKQTDNRLLVNLSYLSEHDLITFSPSKCTSGEIKMHSATITAQGLDFLADDGGLSAVLGVVTVRLHEDSLKALLIERVSKSDEEKSVKDRLVQKIKDLPAEALASVTMKALESGLSQIPNIVPVLQKLLIG